MPCDAGQCTWLPILAVAAGKPADARRHESAGAYPRRIRNSHEQTLPPSVCIRKSEANMTFTIVSHHITDNPLHLMTRLQLAWYRLYWQKPQILFSGAWLADWHVTDVAESKPLTDHHNQLAVPPVIAVEGEPALFSERRTT